MKLRRDAVVKIVGDKNKLHDAESRILAREAGYDLYVSDHLVAGCEYAKRLSDWAFINNARSVRHHYDLGLSDWEP